MAFMEFINTVGTVLGTAKKFLSVYNAVTEDESDRGFAAPQRIKTESRIRPASPPMKTMETPLGMDMPKYEAMFTYFADNLSRDQQLASLQVDNYRAGIAGFDSRIKPTMTVADAALKKDTTRALVKKLRGMK